MTNDSDSNKPTSDADRHPPSHLERSAPAPEQNKVRADSNKDADGQPAIAQEMRREFRWFEFASLFINAALVVVGIYALCIYSGQLQVMRGQLGEIIKQFPEIQKSANAAKSAAETADATLKSSQKSFEIDQRPYMVTEIPQFSGNGLVADKGIQANITFKNIGRTPALKYLVNITLLRYDPSPKGPKGQARFKRFLNSAFDELKSEDTIGRKEIDALPTEQDIAPNGTVFSANQNIIVVPTKEFPRITTSDITLFYVGVASYTDAFGGKYRTEFCYFYFGINPSTWHICDAYNTIR